ncbi:hypothetical protein WR25_00933 [Diploscapter pachys]|uniref:Uncharacterized protein n=1 Tax=Diploscapter pachys TaxID=2018661 RepID=A0A2A2K1Q1_9BILA|nr:hypothetical protein WR25_00933 [Diploscapter pachys]
MVGQLDRADPPLAQFGQPIARLPIDRKHPHPRPVPAPREQIRLADRRAGQRPADIHRIRLQPVGALDRRRHHARRRTVDEAVDGHIAIMRRQPDCDPVASLHPPTQRDARQRAHPRTSISGTDTASPARNVDRATRSRSSAKRTITSKVKLARTTAPLAGAVSSTTTPSASTLKPCVATPSTPIRTLPATGRTIRRVAAP